MQTHIQKCAEAAAQHIDSLLEDENEPFTMNFHYYAEYRSKFLNHYKSDRLRSKSSFIRNLEDGNNSSMMNAVNETISSLAKLGLHSVDASSLASLLPPDPMEPAIEIMADVRAYFQGKLLLDFIIRTSWLMPRHSRIQALCRQRPDEHRQSFSARVDTQPRNGTLPGALYQRAWRLRALQEASERTGRYSRTPQRVGEETTTPPVSQTGTHRCVSVNFCLIVFVFVKDSIVFMSEVLLSVRNVPCIFGAACLLQVCFCPYEHVLHY